MAGRDYTIPDDVQALAKVVLSHRVLPSTQAQLAGRTVSEIIDAAVEKVAVPDRR